MVCPILCAKRAMLNGRTATANNDTSLPSTKVQHHQKAECTNSSGNQLPQLTYIHPRREKNRTYKRDNIEHHISIAISNDYNVWVNISNTQGRVKCRVFYLQLTTYNLFSLYVLVWHPSIKSNHVIIHDRLYWYKVAQVSTPQSTNSEDLHLTFWINYWLSCFYYLHCIYVFIEVNKLLLLLLLY